MSVNEELQEHAEHASDPFSRKAGAGMAIIAAFLAMVAVYAHITTTEELLSQQKASDQWAYYQAKSIRRYESEVARDILGATGGAAAARAAEKYAANFARYQKESEEIQEKAREYERESAVMGKRALRLHFGEVFLEIAIVLSSLAILTRRYLFWYMGIAGAVIGLAGSATVFLLAH